MGLQEDVDILTAEVQARYPTVNTTYDGDPNLAGNPEITGAPLGSIYHEPGADAFWRKDGGGTWAIIGSGGSSGVIDYGQTTEGAITFTIDGAGTDPAAPIVVLDQADADAHGDFLTVKGALDTLPNTILHAVVLEFPDGNWNLAEGDYNNLERFNLGRDGTNSGSIEFASANGIIAEPGPATMAVSSSDGAGSVTLAADPGFAADQYQDFHLECISGTGAGQFKPIRSHATTAFAVAGSFSPALDGTSVVRISRPAASIQFPVAFPIVRTKLMDLNNVGIRFNAIDVLPFSALAGFEFQGGTFTLAGGSRMLGGFIQLAHANLLHETCVITGIEAGFQLPGIAMQGSLFRTSFGNSRPMLLRGGGAVHSDYAFSMIGSQGSQAGQGMGSVLFLFGAQALDGWDLGIAFGRSQFTDMTIESSGSSFPRTDGSSDHAVVLQQGATAVFNDLAGFSSSTFVGSVDDVSLDGDDVSFATVDADADKAALGSRQSVIQEGQ